MAMPARCYPSFPLSRESKSSRRGDFAFRQDTLDSLNSQTKCNTELLRCCHGNSIWTPIHRRAM